MMKGIFRIIMLTAEDGFYPPELHGPVQFSDDPEEPPVEFASLIKVQPRWVHYREVTDSALVTGRLGDYMPAPKGTSNFDPLQL